MNVVDSSAWLEYFADGPAAGFFAPAIEDTAKLLVPTVSLYEVFKRMLQQLGENAALNAVAIMQKGEVIDFTAPIALSGANLRVKHKLPLAGSAMYATARAFDATFWTMDADFEDLPNVRYRRAGSAR